MFRNIQIYQRKYGIKDKNVYNYDNMHEIADNPDIDVIYIVLPNSMHAKYSIIAADAGKPSWNDCKVPHGLVAALWTAARSSAGKAAIAAGAASVNAPSDTGWNTANRLPGIETR